MALGHGIFIRIAWIGTRQLWTGRQNVARTSPWPTQGKILHPSVKSLPGIDDFGWGSKNRKLNVPDCAIKIKMINKEKKRIGQNQSIIVKCLDEPDVVYFVVASFTLMFGLFASSVPLSQIFRRRWEESNPLMAVVAKLHISCVIPFRLIDTEPHLPTSPRLYRQQSKVKRITPKKWTWSLSKSFSILVLKLFCVSSFDLAVSTTVASSISRKEETFKPPSGLFYHFSYVFFSFFFFSFILIN